MDPLMGLLIYFVVTSLPEFEFTYSIITCRPAQQSPLYYEEELISVLFSEH